MQRRWQIYIELYKTYFSELNQSRSNEINEQDIIEKSKVAQLGQFNDIDNGNASTVFYGGIVFPKNFDYDDNHNAPDMSYKIRFIPNTYTEYDTDTLYSHEAGPGNSGMHNDYKLSI